MLNLIKYKLTIFIISFFSLFLSFCNVESYYFWLKSADDTPENISNIELLLDVKLPVAAFIFDPREDKDVLNTIDKIVDILWADRIYHITISPDDFSAYDVAMWAFDDEYTSFFKKIKEKNLHVIFRTMHEMNGWRYPRSSDPERFKAAWIHVRTLSRVAGLTEENIAFDFSVNHWDMPTKQTPSQSASLIQCNIKRKDCYHFEDYYPWDEFVDIIWFTFYNRWKASSSRLWLTPEEILYDPNWNTYERIQNFWKPVVIDEVWTTTVRYPWAYNYEKSREEYLNNSQRKNERLSLLLNFLLSHEEIIVASYFNTDYTQWLNYRVTWEADWAIVDFENHKIYDKFWDLDLYGEKDLNRILDKLFHLVNIKINWKNTYISSSISNEVWLLSELIDEHTQDPKEKFQIISKLMLINYKSESFKKALTILYEAYKYEDFILKESDDKVNENLDEELNNNITNEESTL